MSLILVTSIIIRLAGLAWSVILLHRLRDWRLAFLTLTLGLMAARQAWTLVSISRSSEPHSWIWLGPKSELPGLVVSVMAVLAVVFLGKLLKRLNDAEEIRRSITESSPDYIMMLDLDSRIRFINRTVPELSPERVVGTSVYDYVPERCRPEMRACLEGVRRTGQRDRFETCFRGSEGERTFEAHVGPVMHDGRVVALIINSRDVTESRRIRGELDRARRLESLGQLAGGVAHDFNNLLTTMLGNTELALADLGQCVDGDASKRLAKPLRQVRSAGERAAALTRQLLAIGRRQVARPEVLQLNRVLEQMEELLRRLAGEAIDVSIDLEPALPCIEADSAQLEQILVNLVLNALDAMEWGGRLRIETTLGAAQPDRAAEADGRAGVVLTVADTGHGIDEETLQHIFDPFFTTKPEGTGTGLGLASVYGIVQQMGGHIEVESRVGDGTVFRIHFPASRYQEAPPRPEVERVEPRGGGVVLVCDDQPEVRQVTVEMLRLNGYTVLDAAEGLQCLEVAEAYPGRIDLLVTDVVMPGMDGAEVAERLAARRPETRVLFVSGYANAVDPRRAGPAEAGFLQKPYSSQELLHEVRKLLRAG